MLLIQQEGMGRGHAASAVNTALAEYDIGLVVCLGIAGGLSADLKLGDVCYTGTVIDVHDNAKASDSAQGSIDLDFAPKHFATPRALTAAIEFFQTLPETKYLYENWQNAQREFGQGRVPSPVFGRGSLDEAIGSPKAVSGSIVCGAISKSENYNKKLASLDRKILAIETESGGIFEAAKNRSIPALTIRGVCDYANDSKSDLETSTSGEIRTVAARNAATFLALQITNVRFLAAISIRHNSRADGTTATSERQLVQIDDLARVVAEVGQEIDSKLRELSPEFKLLAKGYHLPVPRVSKINEFMLFKPRASNDPEDLKSVLQTTGTMALSIPRNYPDLSLPWVIARELLSLKIGADQIIPIVIDASLVKPPKSDLNSVVSNRLIERIKLINGAKIVYIIDNIQLTSKSKTDYLLQETDRRNIADSHVMFILRDELSSLRNSEFISRTGATIYKLCEVSFSEITNFVQRNFNMTGDEAEVVALRLRKTFTQFRLDAHPTYFAGIPREILWKILEANRRTELIGLAVSGFLSFVVADDRADVSLSRSTRERFLKSLACEINVRRRRFDEQSLVGFVKDFAQRHDFDIDPIGFIHGFIDKGIIRIDGDVVSFSLTFIECYLLASALKEDESLAIEYFDIDRGEFDFSTFDIYAEIGPSPTIVASILARLKERVGVLKSTPNTPILLSGKIHPKIMQKDDRLRLVRNQLAVLTSDVKSGKGRTTEKQKLLDIADRAHREVAQDSAKSKFKHSIDRVHVDEEMDGDSQIWSVGAYLIGSGAE